MKFKAVTTAALKRVANKYLGAGGVDVPVPAARIAGTALFPLDAVRASG